MRDKPQERPTNAELKARSLSRWENEGGATAKKAVKGWLIAVVYLGCDNDARGFAEHWAASFGDSQAAMAAVIEKSGASSPKVVRQLDAVELARVGITEVAMVAPFQGRR